MKKSNFENQQITDEDKSRNKLDTGEKILYSTALSSVILGLCFIVNNVFTQYPAPRELECEVVMKPAPIAQLKTIHCTRQNYTQEFMFKDLFGNIVNNVNDALREANLANPAIVDSVRFSPDGYSITLETPLDFNIKAFEEKLTREIHTSNL